MWEQNDNLSPFTITYPHHIFHMSTSMIKELDVSMDVNTYPTTCTYQTSHVGSYDVTQKEIRLLFDMAASPPSTSPHLESSPSSPLYMPLYHSPLVPEELQMQMLYVIGRLAERSAPANYFSFDGLVSCLRMVPLVRFPASKAGYSMNCWLQISLFFEQESSLLTWEDHTGAVIFELLFVCHPALKPARFLAVRTRQGTFPFRQFCFEEGSDWHHLVVCHDKRALRITLDGQGISLIKELTYPVAAKATPLCGRVGAGIDSHATSFCGAIGSVNFFEGAVEKHHVKLLFEQGPLFGDTRDFKQLGIANKVFLTLNPEDFELEGNKSKVQLAAITTSSSPDRSPFLLVCVFFFGFQCPRTPFQIALGYLFIGDGFSQ